MHRLCLTLFAALSTSLASAGSALAQKPTEPFLDGRPLSAYVVELAEAAAPHTRNNAAYSIARMGPAAKSAVPALITALKDPEAAVRFPVCIALREIGPDAMDAVPALKEALEDRNEDVAAMARRALIRITGEDPWESRN
jgi:HEAT repeat protein